MEQPETVFVVVATVARVTPFVVVAAMLSVVEIAIVVEDSHCSVQFVAELVDCCSSGAVESSVK